MGIGKRVRQGCWMVPENSNMYAETLTGKALEKIRGILVGGEGIKTIKYLDDQTVMTE